MSTIAVFGIALLATLGLELLVPGGMRLENTVVVGKATRRI
jgi:hypothetical protein